MRKHRFNSFMTAAVIASTLLTATACSKTFAPVDTLPVGTELPADTSTSTEAASKKQDSTTNKGGNTKETGTTKESGNASKDTGTGKDTGTKESDATEKSGEGNVSGEASKDSEAATKAGSDSSVTTATTTNVETSKAAATVTETTTSKVTESTTAATQAPTEKATEKQTEKAAEKQTEKPTEHPAQKPTEPATQAHTHNYTATVTKQPTCTAEGVKTFRCSCGDSYTEAISAAGHVFGAYVYNNDATEAADGTETAACTICGAKDTRTAAGTKIAHVHNYTAAVTKAATCAEEGVKTYTCSCGSSYTEAVPVIAHSFGEYVYNNDATTEADGTKTAICSICGKTDTVTAEGTKKTLPSWYDEHPDIPLNQTRGSQHDGSLEVYFTDFDWTGASMGSDAFGYSVASVTVGKYAEGWVMHGYLY
mgnify:FL=1|jgi:hypothetical protein